MKGVHLWQRFPICDVGGYHAEVSNLIGNGLCNLAVAVNLVGWNAFNLMETILV